MATFKPVVFTTKNHIKNDGTVNIKIRIYHNKTSQYIPTQYYIKPDYLKNGEIIADCPDSEIYNFELGEIIQEYRKASIKLGTTRLKIMSCRDLKEYIESAMDGDTDQIDFIKFIETVISKTTKKKTASWYFYSMVILKWFYKKDSVDVREITMSKLEDLIEKLRISGPKGKPLEPGGISYYIRGIRSLFKKCKKKYNDKHLEIIRIPHYPFEDLEIPQAKRRRKNIGITELQKIREGVYLTERENIGRDVFMMMFYLMGININDLFCLEPPVNGRIEYMRSKTETNENLNSFPLSIKLEPELQELIDKYSPDGFLSTIKIRYSDSYNFMKAVNKGLKKICEDNNLPKITTNWARHTWASLARNKAGISKADIDFCLGHVNNDYKMADIYIDIDYSIYDEVNRKVLDLIK